MCTYEYFSQTTAHKYFLRLWFYINFIKSLEIMIRVLIFYWHRTYQTCNILNFKKKNCKQLHLRLIEGTKMLKKDQNRTFSCWGNCDRRLHTSFTIGRIHMYMRSKERWSQTLSIKLKLNFFFKSMWATRCFPDRWNSYVIIIELNFYFKLFTFEMLLFLLLLFYLFKCVIFVVVSFWYRRKRFVYKM